jgi:type I restriction enzyme S subunit
MIVWSRVMTSIAISRFIEMFGDPISNPKGWSVYKLVDICDKITDGTHHSPENHSTGEYKYITAKNIKESGFDFSNITYVSKADHDEIFARCNPEKGDVLYIKDGVTTGIAMTNTLTEPFSMLSSVALLKQNRESLTSDYLCGVLNSPTMYDSIRRNMGGAAITRLTIKKISEIRVPLPPITLQQEYVRVKEQTDKSKFSERKMLFEHLILIVASQYVSSL